MQRIFISLLLLLLFVVVVVVVVAFCGLGSWYFSQTLRQFQTRYMWSKTSGTILLSQHVRCSIKVATVAVTCLSTDNFVYLFAVALSLSSSWSLVGLMALLSTPWRVEFLLPLVALNSLHRFVNIAFRVCYIIFTFRRSHIICLFLFCCCCNCYCCCCCCCCCCCYSLCT